MAEGKKWRCVRSYSKRTQSRRSSAEAKRQEDGSPRLLKRKGVNKGEGGNEEIEKKQKK